MMKKIALLVVLAALGGCDAAVDSQMQDIENKVATDAEEQYRIASESGGPMDACVAAGMAAAGWLQANNQEKYAHWKAIEKADCGRAGLPQQ